MSKEIWKDIKGYKGLYQASSLGRFKSLRTGRILSPTFYRRTRESSVNILCLIDRKKKYKSFVASRVIAELFIQNPDPEKYTVVKFRGDVKSMHPSNLYWTSHSHSLIEYWKPRHIRKKILCRKCTKVFIVKGNGKRRYCSRKCCSDDQMGKSKKWTKEGKSRMVISKYKPVVGTFRNEEVTFGSLEDAAEFINRNQSGVSNAIAGRQWTCAGWRFRFKK